MRGRCLGVLAAALLCCAPASARVVEETFEVPAEVRDIEGRVYQHSLWVTVFRDETRAKSPFLIISHGRGASPARAALGRSRYAENSHYFVSRGFAVFVPTRIGYGMSGGPDVENSGQCDRRAFAPAFEAGAAQVMAVIEYAKRLPFVDPSRGVLVGQSVGGAITLAVSTKHVDGVLGAINFAGGSGGDPNLRPEEPCSEGTLRHVFAGYGANAKIPSLWLYSANDRYWGRDYPHKWFKAYRTRGAEAQFVQLPEHGTDGHASFTRNPEAWIPAVEKFMSHLGFAK